jgi:hypothetical protein
VIKIKKFIILVIVNLENEVRDFDDFPIDDLDGSNDIYGEGLPLEDNIHQINDDLGF